MTAYNKLYVSVLKNNTNYEATIIASSFSNDSEEISRISFDFSKWGYRH